MDIEDTGDLIKNIIQDKNKETKQKNKIKIKPHSKKKSFEEEEKNKNKKINIYIKTFGCSHNASDSEYMAGILASEGYSIVNSLEQSDLTIINSCTVKSPSQASFLNTVIKSQNFNKKLIVGGCVPQAERNLKGLENISIVGVSQIDKINLIVKETLKGNVIRFLENKKLPSLLLPKIRRNKFIEIIPISQGCLGSCTYCKTKQARGKLISYPIKEILESCKKAYLNNAKELWITSEDTGVYGRDIGTNLPNLLVEILKEIPEDVMIRIGMANPPYILENINNMIKILNHPNVYSFIHIPVQSGSNAVLDKMLREYTIEEFNFLCDKFIEGVPNITLATDIICGFPTETKENFEETLNLVEKYKFPVINISQFYPRPGTVAAKWKKIDTKEAEKLPGVKNVITGDYYAKRGGLYLADKNFLAHETAKYRGEAVVAVCAETPEIAHEACKLVKIDYEELPAVLSPMDALKPDAPLVHPELETYRVAPIFHPVPGTNISVFVHPFA